jgi:DNA-binding SARP family transcriptional activator
MRWSVAVMDLPTRRHGNSGFPYPAFRATHVAGRCLREGVAGFPEGLRDVLQVVDLPRDPRGIVLLCGYVAAGAFGLGTLIAIGDPIGWAYLALAVVGFFFLQTRGLTSFLWLLVACGGALIALSGNSSGWIECVLGLTLGGVALSPLPPEYRESNTEPSLDRHPLHSNGSVAARLAIDSSAKAEESAPRTSANAEVSQTSHASGNGSSALLVTVGQLRIKGLGRLELKVDGTDVAKRLEPRLQFLFSFLFARWVLGNGPIHRTALAEEIAPGMSRSSQLDRLRKQLHELSSVDAALAALVQADRDQVGLELDGASCDVVRLVHTAQQVRAEKDLIDAGLAAQVSDLFESSGGEFLAGFEDLEHQVTRGRGTASEIIRPARLSIAGARADLALAIAQHELAIGRAERAIPPLVTALETCPQRQDLARSLVGAYLQTGQIARARDARREYDLIEES